MILNRNVCPAKQSPVTCNKGVWLGSSLRVILKFLPLTKQKGWWDHVSIFSSTSCCQPVNDVIIGKSGNESPSFNDWCYITVNLMWNIKMLSELVALVILYIRLFWWKRTESSRANLSSVTWSSRLLGYLVTYIHSGARKTKVRKIFHAITVSFLLLEQYVPYIWHDVSLNQHVVELWNSRLKFCTFTKVIIIW